MALYYNTFTVVVFVRCGLRNRLEMKAECNRIITFSKNIFYFQHEACHTDI